MLKDNFHRPFFIQADAASFQDSGYQDSVADGRQASSIELLDRYFVLVKLTACIDKLFNGYVAVSSLTTEMSFLVRCIVHEKRVDVRVAVCVSGSRVSSVRLVNVDFTFGTEIMEPLLRMDFALIRRAPGRCVDSHALALV